ncbi:hypothetical protein CNMCM6805_003710 [Aspergillus fumigatiaffinis]|uniref:HAT C-terminal dimerisation domain-containing protein n=1 Tax=Aspergillus fumigatiaffinis TaxID=340414 RepID=A0A8H4GRG3_9EURO|nr:hypothetical protein CNMCM5878_009867 [Aspergillus fumigatiaffinis]KAF4225084.1 hypothetical protein CNMCM6457_008653 [Aspergillus fumigatiaffinis]KAF4227017.1 hypothetical protein CNMCM6805_003710 [Aspergillus fumigatiaffinis]
MASQGQASDAYPSSVPDGDQIEYPAFDFPQDVLGTQEWVEGAQAKQTYILYSEMSKDAFVAWWLETDFGKKKRIYWDGRHHAKCWEQFEQVAHGKTGKPGVMCTHCRAVLDHPASGHTGTSSMNKHINGPGCRKSTGRTTNILASMQRAAHKASKKSEVVFTQETRNGEYHEILLGFVPLHGAHSGVNLGSLLFELLQQHQIAHRVLAITTDNASNNNTLMSSIQESVQSLGVGNAAIIRIPCIAHIIQLSLNDLLGLMKANPKNETIQTDWSDTCSGFLDSRHQNTAIANTLNKIRKLAIFINASPQRWETFCSLQTKDPKLMPIQDVKTRWNSTFLMLQRAKRLQSTYNAFCSESQYALPHLTLDHEEWRHIEYLLCITQPLFRFTTLLSQTRDVSIHLVFSIYNKLFDHLEKSMDALRRKRVLWKQLVLKALEAAKSKLSHCYAMTDDIPCDLYAIDPDQDWLTRYRKSLEDYLEPYKKDLSDIQSRSKADKCAITLSELEVSCMPEDSQPSLSDQRDELAQYLESGIVRSPPRIFWKDHQHDFPALARLARDVLSISATGAGVERLFNSA